MDMLSPPPFPRRKYSERPSERLSLGARTAAKAHYIPAKKRVNTKNASRRSFRTLRIIVSELALLFQSLPPEKTAA